MTLPAPAESGAGFAGLRAMFVNCTLTRSPARSHTQGLVDRSAALMERHGVTVDQIRAVDHAIAVGVQPDMTEHGWDRDDWPALIERILAADILVIAGPIWHIGYTIPPQADAGWIGEVGPGPSYLDEGSGGPENEFTRRNTTFMTYNLMHLAAMLRSSGGIPALGNLRSEWDAGCRPESANPRAPVMAATMRTSMRNVAVVLVAAATLAGCATAPLAVADARPDSTTLTPCTDLPDLPTALCGSITVPLDRKDPELGSTTVGFAVVPRTDQAQPTLGTIAVNPGGPGPSVIDQSGSAFAQALAPLLDRRDLLLVDPRGVGRSEQLRCTALEDPAPFFAPLAAQRAAIAGCGEQLGDAARHHTTTAVADDIDDVRAALGIEQLDLLGLSCGTFLMATYAQRHPTHVRSIVLSGAYAVNNGTSEGVAATALRRAVGLVCDRSGGCDGTGALRRLTGPAWDASERHDFTDNVNHAGSVLRCTSTPDTTSDSGSSKDYSRSGPERRR